MLSEEEQKKNLKDYFKRKLTHDEVFIVEWIYAWFDKEIKKIKEQFLEQDEKVGRYEKALNKIANDYFGGHSGSEELELIYDYINKILKKD